MSFLYEIDFLAKGKIDVLMIKRMGEKFVVILQFWRVPAPMTLKIK